MNITPEKHCAEELRGEWNREAAQDLRQEQINRAVADSMKIDGEFYPYSPTQSVRIEPAQDAFSHFQRQALTIKQQQKGLRRQAKKISALKEEVKILEFHVNCLRFQLEPPITGGTYNPANAHLIPNVELTGSALLRFCASELMEMLGMKLRR